MNLIDSHETSTINCTEDNRGQWRVERSKLEEYIQRMYEQAARNLEKLPAEPKDDDG